MKIGLVGMNHKSAPIEIRERISLACASPDQPALVRELLHIDGVKEGVYLSTCNRVEALFASENLDRALNGVVRFLAGKFQANEREFRNYIYTYVDEQALHHLFRVAASLDSMVVGEPQILGQVKESYRLATESNATGVVLNRLLHRAFFVAKRVRTETRIGNAAVSISYAAVELARKIFDDLSTKSVMLVGAGEMAELAVRHLMNNGVREIIVANRTLERAMELAENLGGTPVLLDEIEDWLRKVDIIISSTGSPDYVIRTDQVKRNMRKRRERPLFFIDIAVPRDIDPAINDLRNTYVYNIDELQGVVESNLDDRKLEAVRAERIIEEEAIKFVRWMEELDVVPTIVGLLDKSEAIRQAELKKTLTQLKDLSPREIDALETLTRSMIKKMLHDPIQFLKRERTHEERKELDIDFARRIFNLKNESGRE